METTELMMQLVEGGQHGLASATRALNEGVLVFAHDEIDRGHADETLGHLTDEYVQATEALTDHILPFIESDTDHGSEDATDRLNGLLTLDVTIAALLSHMSAQLEQADGVVLTASLASMVNGSPILSEFERYTHPLLVGDASMYDVPPDNPHDLGDANPVKLGGGQLPTVQNDVNAIVETTAADALRTIRRAAGPAGPLVTPLIGRILDDAVGIRDELNGVADVVRVAVGRIAGAAVKVWRAAARKIAVLINRDGVASEVGSFFRKIQQAVGGAALVGDLSSQARAALVSRVRGQIANPLLGAGDVRDRCDSVLATAGDPAELIEEVSRVVAAFENRRRFVRWGNFALLAFVLAPPDPAFAVVAGVIAAIVLTGNYWKAHDHLDSNEVGVLSGLPDRNRGLVQAVLGPS